MSSPRRTRQTGGVVAPLRAEIAREKSTEELDGLVPEWLTVPDVAERTGQDQIPLDRDFAGICDPTGFAVSESEHSTRILVYEGRHESILS